MPASAHPALVLVVEDDIGDQILIRESLEAGPVAKQVQIAGDGAEALALMYPSDPQLGPRPDLILLDLNMPRLGGRELAARLKADPALKTIPIVAFTTSCREEDVNYCYWVGVNSYVQKPTSFDDFQSALLRLETYWLGISERPAPHALVLTVLYIDDDPDARLLIRELIIEGQRELKETIDVRLLEAAGVDEAITLYAASDPGLILLDNRLGTEDGVDLLWRVKEVWKCPVWILTGVITERLRDRSARYGAAGVISKDYIVEHARNLVSFLLESTARGRV